MTPERKTFAPNRERTEEGWLVYPRDKKLRSEFFDEDLIKRIITHPAKMNAHLLLDIVEFVSEPGDRILDVFGGVGTTLLAATRGREVVLMEIEQYYCDIIVDSMNQLDMSDQLNIIPMLIQGDNRLALPFPCDHIITSPPYGNDLAKESESAALTDKIGKQGMQYTSENQNIGKQPEFIYVQIMKRVYKLMVQSVKIGGTITVTHRDRTRAGKRILYIETVIRTLLDLGCEIYNLDKWKVPGSLAANVNKGLGVDVVLDEDIIIMRRIR
ncbi:hypothetical protein LCGC14_1642860 [marine sediment metagenome]|uniref:DNA methylase N-4/N-6 domain-containing protein n=1 Tax=marine sediment metagenome TaxID=412755 RepID=A0A0F9HZW2_9ZZZZ